MNSEDKFSSCVGLVVSGVVAVIISTFADGWALSTIWNWFIPPIFGLTSLTIMKAIGVAMVFSLFTRTNGLKKSDDKNEYTGLAAVAYSSIVTILTALLTVGIAWIILQFAF